MITWIVGAAACSAVRWSAVAASAFTGSPVPWARPGRPAEVLAADAARSAGRPADGSWAHRLGRRRGDGVHFPGRRRTPSSTRSRGLLDALRGDPPGGPGCRLPHVVRRRRLRGLGRAARSTTATVPRPAQRLRRAEAGAGGAGHETARRAPAPWSIGRVSNLYGPGQNLAQAAGTGLAARAGGAHAAAASTSSCRWTPSVTTSTSTTLPPTSSPCAPSAGRAGRRRRRAGHRQRARASRVGQLIRSMQLVTKRRVPIALGTHPSSTRPGDRPAAGTRPTTRPGTSLPAGMKRVQLDLLARLQRMPVTA